MSMTVNISGTFSEKQRPNNGLERVADFLHENRIAQVPVVALVEWHAHGETKTGEKLAVSITAIEPGFEEDGSDPDGIGRQIRDLLDQLRKRQGLGSVEDTLFSAARETGGFDFDGPAGGEMEGQGELIRLGPDGEHTVPEASGEELLAEAEEARVASVPPAAEFSGGDQ